MENQEKNSKKTGIRVFRKSKGVQHFTADSPIKNDVLGSYTGTPLNSAFAENSDDLFPVQDADDL